MKQLYARFPNGTLYRPDTATVGELIAHLSKFPEDTPVAYEWECQIVPVVTKVIELRTEMDKYHKNVVTPIVVMNAD